MEKTSGGIAVTTIIAIVLMTLKLLGKIALAWKWIVLIWLSPLALGLVFVILITIASFLLCLVGKQTTKKKVL